MPARRAGNGARWPIGCVPKVPKLAALMEEDPEKTAGTHGLAKRVLHPIHPIGARAAIKSACERLE
jgi:hypothetical protein